MSKTSREWIKSGLSVEDNKKSFKNFEAWNEEVKDMKTVATNYFLRYENIKNERNNSILLVGQPGSGKTHLSMALANNLIKKGKKVIYMPYVKTMTEIKQNVSNSDIYKSLMDKYKNAEILFIDDLLKGKTTEYDVNVLFDIINHRYINNLPMIISTEKDINNFLDFDEAIGSRVYEMCKDYYKVILGKENNYRMRGM